MSVYLVKQQIPNKNMNEDNNNKEINEYLDQYT